MALLLINMIAFIVNDYNSWKNASSGDWIFVYSKHNYQMEAGRGCNLQSFCLHCLFPSPTVYKCCWIRRWTDKTVWIWIFSSLNCSLNSLCSVIQVNSCKESEVLNCRNIGFSTLTSDNSVKASKRSKFFKSLLQKSHFWVVHNKLMNVIKC